VHSTQTIKLHGGQGTHQCSNEGLINSLGALFHNFHKLFPISSFGKNKHNVVCYANPHKLQSGKFNPLKTGTHIASEYKDIETKTSSTKCLTLML